MLPVQMKDMEGSNMKKYAVFLGQCGSVQCYCIQGGTALQTGGKNSFYTSPSYLQAN